MITARRLLPKVLISPSTKLYYPLHFAHNFETAGPVYNVFDYSQNDFHGVLGSAITYKYPGFDFDGTNNSIITVGNIGTARTFSCWFKPVSIAVSDVLFWLEGVDSRIYVSTGVMLTLNLTNASTFYINGVVNTAVTAGVWQMITMTLNGDEGADSLVIGNNNPALVWCNGVLAGILISTNEFSAIDVLNLFNTTKWRYGV